MTAAFALDEKLAADTIPIGDWRLSRILLMNDSRFSWLILVPRVPNATEMFDLDEGLRRLLMEEVTLAAGRLKTWARAKGGCDKINIAMIGNIVSQLHVHVVVRTRTDAAWPAPVWGSGPAIAYPDAVLELLLADLRRVLRPAM